MQTIERHPDWYYPIKGMRTLILGTFPPHRKKWAFEFYFPNKQNRFWKVLASVANTPLTEYEGRPAIEERKKLMRQLRVGVQDVGNVIVRQGESSLDQDISILEFQDLLSIIDGNQKLRTILLTGYSGKTSAYRGFIDYLKKFNIEHTEPERVAAGAEFTVRRKRPIQCIIGNSSSPAAQGIRFETLVEQFRRAIKNFKQPEYTS